MAGTSMNAGTAAPPVGAPASPDPCATAGRGAASCSLPALLLVLFLLAGPQPVRAAHDPAALADLVQQGNHEQAWAIARRELDAHAGEQTFDFLYALAAIETGHVEQGIFALERVLIRSPGFDRARLELARALFLQEDDRRARQEFRIVLSHDPPPVVANRIERYLAAMDRRADRYRTTVTGWVEARAGHDDNVNRAPDTDAVDLGFGTLVLGPGQQDRDSEFAAAAGGVQVSRPLVPGFNLVAGVDGRARSIDEESRFDTRFVRGRVGLRWISGPHTVRGFFEAHRFYVGGDPYQGAGGLSASYDHELDQATGLHAFARVTQLEHDDLEVRDAVLTTIGAGISHRWSLPFNPRGRVMLTIGDEDPDSGNNRARALASRRMEGLSASLGLTPARNWSLRTGLRYRHSEYETNVFPFSDARDVDYYNFSMELDWHPDTHWRVGPYIDYTDNQANIGLYDYERTEAGIRARYTFH